MNQVNGIWSKYQPKQSTLYTRIRFRVVFDLAWLVATTLHIDTERYVQEKQARKSSDSSLALSERALQFTLPRKKKKKKESLS